MNKITLSPLQIALGVVVIGLVSFLVFSAISPSAPAGPAEDNTQTAASNNDGAPEPSVPAAPTAPASSPAKTTTKPSGSTGTSLPAASTAIKVLTPATSDIWVRGQSHTVAWNKAVGISGAMYLVNADTKKVAGWIAGGIEPQQMNFTWDARFVSSLRTGGTATEVAPGRYILRIAFDGRVPEVASGIFTVASGGASSLSYPVIIRNGSVLPSSLTVPYGSRIVFVNVSTASHRITGDTFDSGVIPMNGSYTLNSGTSLKANTSYNYRDPGDYTITGSLIVK